MSVLKVVHLAGSQEEMGGQFGQIALAHGDLEDAQDCLPGLAHRMLKDANHKSATGRILGAAISQVIGAGVIGLRRARPASYRARSNAFFAAAEMDLRYSDQVLLMDVFQNVMGIAGRLKLGPFGRVAARAAQPSCSSLVVWDGDAADNRILHARNFDFPAIGVWDRYPTVVFCSPDEGHRYGYVTTMGVDAPGITGFNEHGLCLAAHTRFHRSIRFNGAAVVDLCHDIVRRAATIDEAIAICRERPVASTWGLCLTSGSERRAVVVETSGAGCWVVKPAAGANHLSCTNRNRHPDATGGQVSPMAGWPEHCDSRQERLEQVAADARERGGLSRQELQSLLGDHCDPDDPARCRAAGGVVSQANTVQSVVFDPEGARIDVSVGAAPTGWGPYVSVDWDWELPVGLTEVGVPDGQARKPLEGAAGEAYLHWRNASQNDVLNHDAGETLRYLEQAVAAAPDEPSYRLLAALLQFRAGNDARALEHLEAGLCQAQSPFRTGQFLLWGARAAEQVGHGDQARQWRERLRDLPGEHLAELRMLAVRELRRPYPRSKLRNLTYNIDLIDGV